MTYRTLLANILTLMCGCGLAQGAVTLKSVPLPSSGGAIGAMAFSPDSRRLAIFRHLNGQNASGERDTVQVLDINNENVVSQSDLAAPEWANTALSTRFLKYSFDGRYLLVATSGRDVLLILDAVSLRVANRVVLHPENQHRHSRFQEGNRHFQGIVSIAVASNADVFGVLTHDEQGVNEIFLGTLSSGQIGKSWGLEHGPTFGALGQTSLSFSDDGTRIAVSVLPDGYRFSKDFNNLHVYNADGKELMSIRTDSLVGQIELLPDDSILASRIDTPSLFSKKPCIEKWDLATKAVTTRYCDPGRHIVSVGVSKNHRFVAGSASEIRKDLEGHVYSVHGRIDVWDAESGALAAYSDDVQSLGPANIQISPDNAWLLADDLLFATRIVPNAR
jgi:hypothetical protein